MGVCDEIFRLNLLQESEKTAFFGHVRQIFLETWYVRSPQTQKMFRKISLFNDKFFNKTSAFLVNIPQKI
ncbi:hypothetical protein [Mesomycoplasma ovipneumoniae]|uniref:hypothetical protein n=1 Tax=Mesomycoplasma ovipneumoniae TaxID=29562 RepID=UPI0030802C44